jgi:hypothetical protein
MSIATAIENGVKDVGSFLANVVTGLHKVGALWNLVQNNGTKALILKIASDVLATVQDTEAAAAAGGINFTLDAEVYEAGKQLIADAEGGNSIIKADLAALGIQIGTKATVPAAVATVKAASPVPALASPGGLGLSASVPD